MGTDKNIKLHIVTDIKELIRVFIMVENKGKKQVVVSEVGGVKENDIKDEKLAVNGDFVKDEKPAENRDAKETENESTKEDNDVDGGESSEEEELELGSLEKPIVILYTQRKIKKVEAYVPPTKGQKEGLDYSKGKGVKLGDIPIVKYNIDRADTEDLQVLHRIMYRRRGKQHNTKKNLRDFCGWPFEKDSKEYKSVKENTIDRLLVPALKWTNNLLCLEKSGNEKESMKDALCEFLLKPVQIDKEVPAKKKSVGGSNSKSSGKKK